MTLTKAINDKAKHSSSDQNEVLEYSCEKVELFTEHIQLVDKGHLYHTDDDENNRADDLLVDKQTNEKRIGKDAGVADNVVDVVPRFIGHTADFEEVNIMIDVAEVVNIHTVVLAIGVPYDENWPQYDCYEENHAKN